MRQIEVFVITSYTLNYTKTASILNLSPPSVHKQITKLEESCNAILFTKHKNQIRLSKSGQYLVEKLKPIYHSLQKINEEIDQNIVAMPKVIRLSMGHSFQRLIFSKIYAFEKMHKDIKIEIHVENKKESLINLGSDTRDISILGKSSLIGSNFTTKIISNYSYVFIAPKHKNKTNNVVTFNEIEKARIFIIKPNTEAQLKILNFLEDNGVEKDQLIFTSSFSTIKSAVSEGLGYGVISSSEYQLSEDYDQVKFEGMNFHDQVYSVFKPHKTGADYIRDFIDFLSSNGPW
ncbi:LysR family transcriptional regulator [Legionella spiritensis]|nr:LysR family transcriptional regulator [Legionella spiritensis]